jgi:hypothetical protein
MRWAGRAETIKLFEAVGKLTDLQTLRLNGTNHYGNDSCYLTTGPETIAALASALTALPHLVELDLCWNSMQSEAADVLVARCSTLRGSLDSSCLRHNHIASGGWRPSRPRPWRARSRASRS